LSTIHCGQGNVITDAKVGEQCIEHQSSMLWVTPSQPSSGGLDAMRMGERIGWWEELIDAIKMNHEHEKFS
jgi:hypothetical protein